MAAVNLQHTMTLIRVNGTIPASWERDRENAKSNNIDKIDDNNNYNDDVEPDENFNEDDEDQVAQRGGGDVGDNDNNGDEDSNNNGENNENNDNKDYNDNNGSQIEDNNVYDLDGESDESKGSQ